MALYGVQGIGLPSMGSGMLIALPAQSALDGICSAEHGAGMTPTLCSVVADFLVALTAQLTAAAVLGVAALWLWRLGGQFVGDYRRLCRKACETITTHSPSIANLGYLGTPPPAGVAARERASKELRRIGDRLTNTECPPSWLTRALGLPAPDDVFRAGEIMRGLSNRLDLPAGEVTAGHKDALETANRQQRDEARRLLGCKAQRPWERA